MSHYLSQGDIPKKRFTVHRPAGRFLYEHLIGAEGFDGESSLLYRLHSPTRVTHVDDLPPLALEGAGPPVGRNLLFRTDRIESRGDFVAARVPALFSGDALIYNLARPTRSMERFYSNTAADELILVVKGSGRVESIFGDIPYEELDLIYVPRGDVMRWVCDDIPHELLVVESRSPIRPPARFLKRNGQFHDNASYHERDMRTPRLREPVDVAGEHPVVMKAGAAFACVWLDHHPFDVVGWDGCFYPFAVNLRDYEPLVGRIDLLPDQYQIFATPETVFTAITPHRLPDIPNVAPAQAFHQNLEFDEVLYRFSGSTRATEPSTGAFTLHPRGVVHGPKPGFENTPERTHSTVWALMMDTRLLVRPSLQAMAALDGSYARTWIEDQVVARDRQRVTGTP